MRDIAQKIDSWMQEQERYKQQLYQLSQRLMLQSQLNSQQALKYQTRQQLETMYQGLENALRTLSLSPSEESVEAAWLYVRESEFTR